MSTVKDFPYFKIKYALMREWGFSASIRLVLGIHPLEKLSNLRSKNLVDKVAGEFRKGRIDPSRMGVREMDRKYLKTDVIAWATTRKDLPMDKDMIKAVKWAEGELYGIKRLAKFDNVFFRSLASVVWDVYTLKSYQTRVANVKRVIRCEGLGRALEIVIQGKKLDANVRQKASDLLNMIDKGDLYPFEKNDIDRLIGISEEFHGLDRVAKVKVRVGQKEFRNLLFKKWASCCLTSYSDVSLLIASHIKPWAVCNSLERVDVNNGLLLLPNLDKLFDKGLISFDEKGIILISKNLNDMEKLGVAKGMSIKVSFDMLKYLEYHREIIYQK